jgi:tRNA-splicing ligase RtcB
MSDSKNRPAVKMSLSQPLPGDVAASLDRLARAEDAVHLAVMPDVHLAQEVCVGAVLATTNSIYPQAVGGDIGCGMAAMAFDVDADALAKERVAARILSGLAAVIPTIRHGRNRSADSMPSNLEIEELSDSSLEAIKCRDGAVQFGTLGRGNHFLEFQADEENRLWMMVHSGSRAMGPAIRDWHLGRATKCAGGLFRLDANSIAGRAYLSDMEWARRYAAANRRAMAVAAAAVVGNVLNAAPDESSFFDCDHNHVQSEAHFEESLWVHRKGAAQATDGQMGIIPGSMGTQSYHVQGRGHADSLNSSSHGAGRACSRHDARRRISLKQLIRQMEGIWFDRRLANHLREEAPAAYKDVRAVLRAQRELTRIVRTLRPVLVYKGS